jgi:tyrosine-protein kinase Etk/Wzc
MENNNNKAKVRYGAPQEPDGMTLKQLRANAVKKWYLFVIFVALGLIISYLYNKVAPAKYKITSTILIKKENTANDLAHVFNEAKLLRGNQLIHDQVGVIKSFTLNLMAMQSLNWQHSWFKKKMVGMEDLYGSDPFAVEVSKGAAQADMVPLTIKPETNNSYTVSCNEKRLVNGREIDYSFEKRMNYGEVFKNRHFNFTLNKTAQPVDLDGEYVLVFNNLSKLALNYKDGIEVTFPDAEANLITMELETHNLRRDVDFVNRLASLYIQTGLDEKNRMANNTVRFIDNLISGVNDSLQIAGNTFTNYRSRNKTVDLGREASSVVEKIKSLDSEQSMINLRLDYYNNLKYYLDNKEDIKDLVAPALVGITDEALSGLVAKLNELYSKREVLSYTVQDKNPTLVALDNEIAYTKKVIDEKVNNLVGSAKLELRNIQGQMSRVNSELRRLPKTEQDLIGIKRNFDLNNELYTFLLEKRAEAEIARAAAAPDAQILDPASPAVAELLGPIKIKNLITGILAGLVIAFLVLVTDEYFSEKLRSLDDAQTRLDFPITASIPENRFKSEIPVIQYPRSAITEAFRGLRINLQNHFRDHHVLAVHSYISGEGKSFIALNMALVMAISNKKVLLVDGDLRRPRLHTILKTKSDAGLSNYLNGKSKIDDIIVPTQYQGLSFVPAGPLPFNPSELLNNGLISIFIQAVKNKFDYIVFDTAPFGVVSDATMVGMNADINLFLLRLNLSKKENVDAINKVHNEGVLKNVLVTLNGVKQQQGYGYYSEEARKPKEVKVST